MRSLSLAFLLAQLLCSKGEAESPLVWAEGERHFHYGTRLPAAKASHTNIIRREQTFPQVRENSQGPGSPPLLSLPFLLHHLLSIY